MNTYPRHELCRGFSFYEKNLKKQTISKSSGFGFDIKFWRYIIFYSSHDLCYGD